jgi:hypothetical protein
MEITFEESLKAESYAIQLRRYKKRYIGMFSVTRQGNRVIVTPGTETLKPIASVPAVFRPVDRSMMELENKPLTIEQARHRKLILEDFYSGALDLQNATEALISCEIATTQEEAETILKESRNAAYKSTAV